MASIMLLVCLSLPWTFTLIADALPLSYHHIWRGEPGLNQWPRQVALPITWLTNPLGDCGLHNKTYLMPCYWKTLGITTRLRLMLCPQKIYFQRTCFLAGFPPSSTTRAAR